MPDETANSGQTARDALQELHNALYAEYRKSKTKEVRDQLDARLDVVRDLLTELNRDDMASRTIAIKAAADSMAEGLKRLAELKERIKSISDNVAKAANVLEDVDKVLSNVKQYFGI